MSFAALQTEEPYKTELKKQLNLAAVCWLTHEVRTASYARYLNATLYNVHYLSDRHPFYAPFKYIPQCLKTWSVLSKQSPDAVYVMNPPVFAALSVFFYCLVSRTPYVMDTHSPSLYGGRWGWTLPLQRALAQRALVNIVDQERFRELFASWGANGIVLERPPLDVTQLVSKRTVQQVSNGHEQSSKPMGADESQRQTESKKHPFHVTLIGQFSGDEPVDVVVAAAHKLPDVRFTILGDTIHAPRELLRSAPSNVEFPGYLSGSDYWDHLASVDAVMTLTMFKYSLLGGAQEGMAMGKPLILSNQPVLTDYFTKGTIFIEHEVDSIVEGVRAVQENATQLGQDVAALAAEKRVRWEDAFVTLEQIITDEVYKG